MSSAQTAIEAVKKSLVVKCSPERAFEVFTREIGSPAAISPTGRGPPRSRSMISRRVASPSASIAVA